MSNKLVPTPIPGDKRCNGNGEVFTFTSMQGPNRVKVKSDATNESWSFLLKDWQLWKEMPRQESFDL